MPRVLRVRFLAVVALAAAVVCGASQSSRAQPASPDELAAVDAHLASGAHSRARPAWLPRWTTGSDRPRTRVSYRLPTRTSLGGRLVIDVTSGRHHSWQSTTWFQTSSIGASRSMLRSVV